MSLLSDDEIVQRMVFDPTRPERLLVIRPFAEATKVHGKVSWGLSSYGYDIRLASEFKVFMAGGQIDPKYFDQAKEGQDYRTETTNVLTLPPHGFALASSVEWFQMPEDVTGQVMCKSTYARAGICLNMTPIEAGWRGHITLEIANLTPCEVVLYANEGIGQILFHEGSQPCRVPYNKKKNAMYQDQGMVVGPRV